jgi:hypothetical protein
MTFTVEEVQGLLDQLEIKYTPKDERLVQSRWRTDKWEKMLINFVLSEKKNWLTVVGYPIDPKCGDAPLNLSKREGVSDAKRFELYEKLLYESWLYNGVKYTLDGERDVAIAIETADTDLTPDELKRYINQVLRAADELMDWL